MVYLREEESGKFFTPKMAKIADFSIAKLQISGRFPQRSVEPFFHNIFEFRLQISRSQDPPVCKLSHMVKAASMSNLNHDENEVSLRNGSQESVKLALVKHACFNENHDI